MPSRAQYSCNVGTGVPIWSEFKVFLTQVPRFSAHIQVETLPSHGYPVLC